MKEIRRTKPVLLLTVLAGVCLQVSPSKAQYRATGDDGITASPKVRQMLNDRAASRRVTSAQSADIDLAHPARNSIVASPKMQAQLNDRKRAVAGSGSVDPNLTDPPRDIAASPKVRQQKSERAPR